jgi:hypothetical protein
MALTHRPPLRLSQHFRPVRTPCASSTNTETRTVARVALSRVTSASSRARHRTTAWMPRPAGTTPAMIMPDQPRLYAFYPRNLFAKLLVKILSPRCGVSRVGQIPCCSAGRWLALARVLREWMARDRGGHRRRRGQLLRRRHPGRALDSALRLAVCAAHQASAADEVHGRALGPRRARYEDNQHNLVHSPPRPQ